MNYMVMETHLSYAIVMDEEGKIFPAANLHYTVGQLVDTVYPLRDETSQKKDHIKKITLRLTSLAASLIVALGVAGYLYQTPHASIYLTVNPTVRIDVNCFDRVIAVEGLNKDGILLTESYSGTHQKPITVLDDLLQRAKQMDYLTADSTVTLQFEASNRWIHRTGAELRQFVNDQPLPEKQESSCTAYDEQQYQSAEESLPIPESSSEPASKPSSSKPASETTSAAQTDYGDTDYDEEEDDEAETDDDTE